MDWMKILAAVTIVGLLVYMWPAYKHFSKNTPEAKEGDWMGALLPLGAVVLLVVLLVMSVR